jgi:hypothetical protein
MLRCTRIRAQQIRGLKRFERDSMFMKYRRLTTAAPIRSRKSTRARALRAE